MDNTPEVKKCLTSMQINIQWLSDRSHAALEMYADAFKFDILAVQKNENKLCKRYP